MRHEWLLLIKRLPLLILAAAFLLPPACWASWGTGGATCLAQNETASTTLACTLATQNLEAGNVAVVTCAGDNVGTLDGNTNDHGPVTDSGGNNYTKAYEFTEAGTGAAAGATVSVHFSKLATQLTSGSSTITCNYGSSLTDRAMHLVGEFTITAGNVVSVAGTPQGEASGGGDAGELIISGLTNGEYLFVRGIATESNDALSMTATASYSLPLDPSDGCNNTTGGGEATDMGACSEYRIFTGTGDTSNPTLVDTSNDNASVYIALLESVPSARNRIW